MGLVRGIARTAVVAGTATAVSGRVQRRQQEKWAEQDQAADGEIQAPPPPTVEPQPAETAAAPEDPMIAQLQEYARLRDQGILTEEEFAAAKRGILGI